MRWVDVAVRTVTDSEFQSLGVATENAHFQVVLILILIQVFV